jgi:tetratricopeptide (TPR) repeat protein
MDRGQAAVELAKTNADLEDAVKEFQKAIDITPGWPDPYYQLGMVQSRLGRLDDALKSLKKYLQIAPNAKDAQKRRIIVLLPENNRRYQGV